MILIADGGSTKTSWALLEKEIETQLFETEAYHPFFVDSDFITNSLKQQLPTNIINSANEITNVFFYSAGTGYSSEADNVIINGVLNVFPQSKIVIETDLLAAARALLQNSKGMAAILGTGSNSCLYDGKNITHNIESLGFILGDEGSGAYIGKKLIGDYIRGYMPTEVNEKFATYSKMNANDLIDHIYTKPMPNKFCAGFCKHISENLNKHEYYTNIVRDAFNDMFRNIISGYPNYKAYSFNCVGSIAYHFRSILIKVVEENGMIMGNILQYPMEGLIKYHL